MSTLLEAAVEQLKSARAIDLSGYRHGPLVRRLAARMRQACIEDGQSYLEFLREDPRECSRLIETLTISVSSFFRDPMLFEILDRYVLAELLERKRSADSRDLRIWSAGCATGEEVYTMAILARETLGEEIDQWNTLIFGTDISENALAAARAGIYDRDRLASTKLGLIDRHFNAEGEMFSVRPSVRKMVRFSTDNLTCDKRIAPADSVFGSFDMVLCRNVLIYFDRPLQSQVLKKLCRSISVGGYLVLGVTESIPEDLEPILVPVDRDYRVFRKVTGMPK